MGLFGRRNERSNTSSHWEQTSHSDHSEPKPPPTKEDKARDYFEEQNVSCFTPQDLDAFVKMFTSLKENNYDTCNDDNLVDAISSLDANLYNLCQAIMYQNFMLLRRVDRLEGQIRELERKFDGQ